MAARKRLCCASPLHLITVEQNCDTLGEWQFLMRETYRIEGQKDEQYIRLLWDMFQAIRDMQIPLL